jgi:rhamnosyltransferase subunit B
MARITVVSMAFWGDVMPFVPIANHLVARGHQVTFAVPEGFHPLLAGEAFALAPAGVQFSPRELAGHGRVVARARTAVGSARAGRFWIGHFAVPHLAEIHEALMAATEDADLVLTHPTAGLCARMPAECRGIPWVTGHLFPTMLASAHHLPTNYPFRRPGHPPDPGHAAAVWRMFERVSEVAMYDKEINAFRRSLGLAPVRANAVRGGLSPTDVLLLSSPRYTPVLPDWPAHYAATGFTIWDGPAGQGLPVGLDEYLDAGDPPVLVTLGTSAATNAERLLTRLRRVLDDLGVRALFLVGDAATTHAALRDRGDAWAFAPLPAVLPRCRAVIHAGGHGTTAAVLSTGRPAVVLPQVFDQVWHGERVEALGAGVMVRRWPTRPGAVTRAVARVLSTPSYAEAAGELAEVLAGEDGPAAACDRIEARLADPIVVRAA